MVTPPFAPDVNPHSGIRLYGGHWQVDLNRQMARKVWVDFADYPGCDGFNLGLYFVTLCFTRWKKPAL